MMKITVRFYGIIREAVGRAEDEFEYPEGVRADLVWQHVFLYYPLLGKLFIDQEDKWPHSVILIKKKDILSPGSILNDGDVVEVISLMAGG